MLGGILHAWRRHDRLETIVDRASPPEIRAGSDSAQQRPESVKSRRRPSGLEHHSPQEHALLLLRWVQQNIDLDGGMIFREAIQEFYAEAVNEAGWNFRPWSPIARQLDLICTGGKKPYQWTADERGRMRRRRHYPIPAVLTKVAPNGDTSERRAA